MARPLDGLSGKALADAIDAAFSAWRLRLAGKHARCEDLFDPLGNYVGDAFPEDCVADCAHPGDVGSSVRNWRRDLDFQVPRGLAVDWLLEFGAWERDEIEALDDVALAERVLWLACGDVYDESNDPDSDGSWLGLVN